MNIESANKKREIISSKEEEDTSSQTLNVPETPKQNGITKKLSQSVISKESLTLVPEGGDNQITQNGYAQEKADNTSETNASNNVEHSDQVRSVTIVCAAILILSTDKDNLEPVRRNLTCSSIIFRRMLINSWTSRLKTVSNT